VSRMSDFNSGHSRSSDDRYVNAPEVWPAMKESGWDVGATEQGPAGIPSSEL
jgi:hypothetical protein